MRTLLPNRIELDEGQDLLGDKGEWKGRNETRRERKWGGKGSKGKEGGREKKVEEKSKKKDEEKKVDKTWHN